MKSVKWSCSRCQHTVEVPWSEGASSIECPSCQLALAVPDDAIVEGEVRRCLVCPSRDLFVRRDFPQRLGVAIVVAGFVASSIAWYYYWTILTFAILFATAAIDVVLYVTVGGVLSCYRCAAEYRGFAGSEKHGNFELATHERYRQQQIRLAEHQRTAPRGAASGDSR